MHQWNILAINMSGKKSVSSRKKLSGSITIINIDLLENYNINENIETINQLRRNKISDINVVEKAASLLFGKYWFTAWFSLILAVLHQFFTCWTFYLWNSWKARYAIYVTALYIREPRTGSCFSNHDKKPSTTGFSFLSRVFLIASVRYLRICASRLSILYRGLYCSHYSHHTWDTHEIHLEILQLYSHCGFPNIYTVWLAVRHFPMLLVSHHCSTVISEGRFWHFLINWAHCCKR